MCAFLVEEFLFSGLAWLSFMKKKVDLSRNSYLNSEINVCIFNLVIVKIFNGFFVLNLIKHFDILN